MYDMQSLDEIILLSINPLKIIRITTTTNSWINGKANQPIWVLAKWGTIKKLNFRS